MTLLHDIAKPIAFLSGRLTLWARLDGLGFILTRDGYGRVGSYRRKADARRAARRMAEKNPK